MSNKDIAIKVENISKRYRIGLKETIHDTFGGAIIDLIKSPFKNYKKYRSLYRFDEAYPDNGKDYESPDIIWALKNVSFEVKREEVVGIIGKNGSGKSTLLKILSKITDPTSGRAEIRGRVSSLLEVGTGFNPELTGRENVYLNGSILGMTKKEVEQKFDEIVDFSGIEKFIDTPVKRYSSGMTVRLAFAVAANLDPEILLIDEVLAVGDAAFQKKCIGKMSSVAKKGRTVLFVSHNMGAVTDLCSRVVWIDEGHLRLDGDPVDVVSEHLSLFVKGTECWVGSPPDEESEKLAWLRRARVFSGKGDEAKALFQYDEKIKIEIEYEIKSSVRGFRSYFFLRDSRGSILWASHDTDGTGMYDQIRTPGIYHSTCEFPELLLRPGRYHISIGTFAIPREAFEEEHLDVISFEISVAGYTFNRFPRQGLITPYLTWNAERLGEVKPENAQNHSSSNMAQNFESYSRLGKA